MGALVLTTEHEGVFIVSKVDADNGTAKLVPVGQSNIVHIVEWRTLRFLEKEDASQAAKRVVREATKD